MLGSLVESGSPQQGEVTACKEMLGLWGNESVLYCLWIARLRDLLIHTGAPALGPAASPASKVS